MKILAIIILVIIVNFSNCLLDLSSVTDSQLGPLLQGNWQQLLPSNVQ